MSVQGVGCKVGVLHHISVGRVPYREAALGHLKTAAHTEPFHLVVGGTALQGGGGQAQGCGGEGAWLCRSGEGRRHGYVVQVRGGGAMMCRVGVQLCTR